MTTGLHPPLVPTRNHKQIDDELSTQSVHELELATDRLAIRLLWLCTCMCTNSTVRIMCVTCLNKMITTLLKNRHLCNEDNCSRSCQCQGKRGTCRMAKWLRRFLRLVGCMRSSRSHCNDSWSFRQHISYLREYWDRTAFSEFYFGNCMQST